MKKLLLVLTAVLTLMSCQSEEDIAYDIVQESKIYPSLKAKEMKPIMINENHFFLKLYTPILSKYIDVNQDNEYGFSRYIFRTDSGVFTMFYIIDMTNKKVVLKRGKFDGVFRQYFEEFMPDSIDFIGGEHTLKWI
tara:strand:- start:2975 stop:3382 length:408 start_codon:yes stop_codon:yes gene_type:complete